MGLVLRLGGRGLGAFVVLPFQETCSAPLYAFPYTYVSHHCLCFLPMYMPWGGGGEDSAKCLTEGLGKNKGRDGSLHNP